MMCAPAPTGTGTGTETGEMCAVVAVPAAPRPAAHVPHTAVCFTVHTSTDYYWSVVA